MIYYSRKEKVENIKNRKKSFILLILTVLSLLLIIKFGLPLLIKYVGFITNLKKSTDVIEISDTTPPPPPNIEDFPLSTNQKSISLKGKTEPGVIVKYTINSNPYEVIADNTGNFNIDLTLDYPENIIELYSEDQSKNKSQTIKLGTIIYDDQPPQFEIISPKDKTEFYGTGRKNQIISGKTETECKVTINGRRAVVDSDGNFSFNYSLSEGENLITASSEDLSGNKIDITFSLLYYP